MNASPTAKRTSRLSDAVAEQLERWITEQHLTSGTQLPTEKSLCERFGVSRAVIREAISRLKADGCVTTRQGSGAFVAARPGQGSFRLVRDPEHSSSIMAGEISDIFELRYLVETGAAERAALRRTAEDLERMRAVLARMQDALVAQVDAVGDDDAFHVAIAIATHNLQIARFQAFMGAQFSDSRAPTWSSDGHRSGRAREAQAEHVRIFEAISRSDAKAAREAAQAHLVSAARRLGLDPLLWAGDKTESTR
ncbi:MAG: FadR/GntR family transcriptional regulator [Aromatoleum sp.]|jgi:GntR family transcriptional repressor for pyruvate dehydrogenase complex|uniref:FadR/GntR family transcriptional regulator n=1 Tax=Aromatoleum sp. TaxID=2307007 RepID=UPI002895CBD8|nr:FadR/GntR family transcriptional regulator [Aromatoleum sp.]MDT3672874.1 FadR/GntR family transcriptional regulator [Aromatoleum sp.]